MPLQPDYVLIGVPKAGTTWLWNMLGQHPRVHSIPFKEVHFFDVLYLGTSKARRLRRIGRNVDLARTQTTNPARLGYLDRITDPGFAFTDEWYEHLFSQKPAGHVTGEMTPFYCMLPDQAIEHLKRLAPNVRLIYFIRDPLTCGISQFRQAAGDRGADEILSSPGYAARGDHRSNITRWEQHFPKDQFLYVPFGDVKTDPMAVMRQVERHLGLEPHARYESMQEARASTASRDIEVTDATVERISELFASQYEFLRARFGEAFVSRIA